VLSFFPEYACGTNGRQNITLRHLLTMTAPYTFEDWREPLDKLSMQDDWVTYALGLLDYNGEIGKFKYSTAGAHLLSTVITRATGKSAREFANERLFKPVGMREIPDYDIVYGFDALFGKDVRGWVKDPAGNSAGGWGLTLTPRDMARFGLLYLQHGEWEGRQVIPAAWVRESVAMNSNRYGYLWWLREEDGVFAFMAMGDGGNAICCVPSRGLVAAITSGFMVNAPDRWTLIKEHILPAI
jgi:CubicO group peptidase (beta-lactamase class C family)